MIQAMQAKKQVTILGSGQHGYFGCMDGYRLVKLFDVGKNITYPYVASGPYDLATILYPRNCRAKARPCLRKDTVLVLASSVLNLVPLFLCLTRNKDVIHVFLDLDLNKKSDQEPLQLLHVQVTDASWLHRL